MSEAHSAVFPRIARSVGETLADAEIAFGRKDRLVPERQLNLLQWRAAAGKYFLRDQFHYERMAKLRVA